MNPTNPAKSPKHEIRGEVGFLAPDGKYYPCDYDHNDVEALWHKQKAVELVRYFYPEDAEDMDMHSVGMFSGPQVFLEERGWIRIDVERVGMMYRPNVLQVDALYRLYKLQSQYLPNNKIRLILAWRDLKWLKRPGDEEAIEQLEVTHSDMPQADLPPIKIKRRSRPVAPAVIESIEVVEPVEGLSPNEAWMNKRNKEWMDKFQWPDPVPDDPTLDFTLSHLYSESHKSMIFTLDLNDWKSHYDRLIFKDNVARIYCGLGVLRWEASIYPPKVRLSHSQSSAIEFYRFEGAEDEIHTIRTAAHLFVNPVHLLKFRDRYEDDPVIKMDITINLNGQIVKTFDLLQYFEGKEWGRGSSR